MKNLLTALFVTATWVGFAQTKVTERATVSDQDLLELKFDFADEITVKTWDKQEVYVEVSVSINDGEYDHIFSLEKRETSRSITIEMDKDMWDKIDRKDNNCSWQTDLYYTVYMPKNMKVDAYTISGDFILTNYPRDMKLKTISGDIDISVPSTEGIDFDAKTISGEIYSDLNIAYPEGKDGLRQIVGMKVKGRINNGGIPMELETISGDIFLRKG
ncbi:DUF4097 family beta strand repeat-containing protein [Marinoscillum sp.]|uniref:DUF4097 family beta strand repeat-containing protein n=1 Tax=Marinoscillum sp. TaxID=2024838 RepID=UPI003BAD087F